MPTLEAALSEAMQGSLSNELDEQVPSTVQAGELNGLFTQATDVAAASDRRNLQHRDRAIRGAGGRPTRLRPWATCAPVIGSKTFALYAGLFANANKGDVSLFDYLSNALGSIRVSDRVPSLASTAQKGVVVLSSSSTPPKIHVYSATGNCARSLQRRGRWQGHDHRDGVGQSALHCRTARARRSKCIRSSRANGYSRILDLARLPWTSVREFIERYSATWRDRAGRWAVGTRQ